MSRLIILLPLAIILLWLTPTQARTKRCATGYKVWKNRCIWSGCPSGGYVVKYQKIARFFRRRCIKARCPSISCGQKRCKYGLTKRFYKIGTGCTKCIIICKKKPTCPFVSCGRPRCKYGWKKRLYKNGSGCTICIIICKKKPSCLRVLRCSNNPSCRFGRLKRISRDQHGCRRCIYTCRKHPRCRGGRTWDCKKRRCVTRCRKGSVWSRSRRACITCSGPTVWSGKRQRCVLRCRGRLIWSMKNRTCVRRCQTWQRWTGRSCRNRCPRWERWYKGRGCLNRCPKWKIWRRDRCVNFVRCPFGFVRRRFGRMTICVKATKKPQNLLHLSVDLNNIPCRQKLRWISNRMRRIKRRITTLTKRLNYVKVGINMVKHYGLLKRMRAELNGQIHTERLSLIRLSKQAVALTRKLRGFYTFEMWPGKK